MKARLTKLLWPAVRVALPVLVLVTGSAAGAEPKRVVLIHSFGRGFAPFDNYSGNFRTELARQSAQPVDLYDFSLESARFSEAPLNERPFVEYIRALFEGRPVDLLVTIGGPAARFGTSHRAELFSEGHTAKP